MLKSFLYILLFTAHLISAEAAAIADMDFIRVGDDKKTFVHETTKQRYIPFGFNYDHDETGRLLEDYWLDEWKKVEEDFAEMKALGATVVRIHIQFGKFMKSETKPDETSLKQLEKLLMLAEKTGLYLDLTGLGCYHKKDVPPWYDALDEAARWKAQAAFWEAVAKTCAKSPAIFCYDLMNEPVAAGGKRTDWLAGAFGGKHFVQFISLDLGTRKNHEVAKAWIDQLVAAIRKHDKKHLITVGMVDWSLDRPGLKSGFFPDKVADNLDFIAVHIYPESKKPDHAMETLKGFDIGKPIIIEEIFPLKCSIEELSKFIDDSKAHATGWIGFYWGRTIEEYGDAKTFGEAVTKAWLELFVKKAKEMQPE